MRTRRASSRFGRLQDSAAGIRRRRWHRGSGSRLAQPQASPAKQQGVSEYALFFIVWATVVLVGSAIATWRVELQVRSWRQPNWTTPVTRNDAWWVIAGQLVFYACFDLAMLSMILMFDGLTDEVDTGRLWLLAPFALAMLCVYALLGRSFIRGGKAPGNAERLKTPGFRQYTPGRCTSPRRTSQRTQRSSTRDSPPKYSASPLKPFAPPVLHCSPLAS